MEETRVSEKPARKFAVVQWSEGDDNGKLSYVKTNAIIGYDDTRMGSDGLPLRPYQASIEWQRGKRPPGGYPYYAANVMFVTGSRYHATRKLNELMKSNMPALLTKRASVPPQKYWEESDDSDIEAPSQPEKRSKVSQVDPTEEFLKMYGGKPQTSSDELNKLRKTISALRQKNKDLEKECQKWKDLVLQDVPGLIFAMKKIICPPTSPRMPGSESRPSSPSQPTSSPSSAVSTQSSTPSASSQSSKVAIDTGRQDKDTTSSLRSKVEIFHGTGVMVDKLAWAYAVNASSATTFVRQLLTAVFPTDILIVSNLRGTNKGKGEARRPLDKTKLDAIYNATLERWPGTPLSLIGSSINGKITEMRNRAKQQQLPVEH